MPLPPPPQPHELGARTLTPLWRPQGLFGEDESAVASAELSLPSLPLAGGFAKRGTATPLEPEQRRRFAAVWSKLARAAGAEMEKGRDAWAAAGANGARGGRGLRLRALSCAHSPGPFDAG